MYIIYLGQVSTEFDICGVMSMHVCFSESPAFFATSENVNSFEVFVFLFLQSRAALSLLGYCYFHIQDFANAAECYEQLVQICPTVDSYKIYYSQALYHACAYPEAMKATFQIENQDYQPKVRYWEIDNGMSIKWSGC